MIEFLVLYIAICLLWILYIRNKPKDVIVTIAPLLLAAIPAAFQAYKGFRQRYLAKKLKESNFVPSELRENQSLAKQQANSRRAPGAARAEENIRKNLATTLGSQSRMFGGDAGKMVSLSSGASARADNAVQGVQAQGQAFSENAFGRLAGANNAVAGQKRQNRDEFNRTKAQLLAASDQNLFNSVSNLSSAAITGAIAGKEGGGFGKGYGGVAGQSAPWADWLKQQNQNYPPWNGGGQGQGQDVWSDPGGGFSPSFRVAPRVNRHNIN